MGADVPEWTADDLRGLAAPTMLVYGDSDIVRPEHMAETFRLLGGGVPGDVAGLPRARLAPAPAPGCPCSPAPPTSPWSSAPTGWPRWSGSSSTPRPADLRSGGEEGAG